MLRQVGFLLHFKRSLSKHVGLLLLCMLTPDWLSVALTSGSNPFFEAPTCLLGFAMQDRGCCSLWAVMRQEISTLDSSTTELQYLLQVWKCA